MVFLYYYEQGVKTPEYLEVKIMYKIATLNKISPVGMDRFSEAYTVIDDTASAQAILVRSQDMHDMDFSDDLMSIARAGAGVNNIPLDRCAEQGIVVFNTPGANANAVKELVLAGMFLATRHLPAALSWMGGLEEDVLNKVEKGKKQFAGTEILGKTLGVIGLGAIGAKVANAACALGMKVKGCDAFLNDKMKAALSDEVEICDSQDDVIRDADFISLHVPANNATKGMVNADFFAKCKDGAILLNFSRDKLVNSQDLLAALESGKIKEYVTDFATDDLNGKPGVVAIPHLGASTEEAEDNCAIIAVDETMDYIENGNVRNSVNYPAADLGKFEGGSRICVMTKGVADPVEAVKAAFSALDITAADGGSRGDFGYVLIQTPADVTEIPAVDGAVKVRVIR